MKQFPIFYFNATVS